MLEIVPVRRVLGVLLFFMSLVSFIFLVLLCCQDKELSISQNEIQSLIDSRLPYNTGNGVNVCELAVYLKAGDVDVHVSATGKKSGLEFSALGSTHGEFRYDAESGAFYFVPGEIKLTSLIIDGKPIEEKTREIADFYIDGEKIEQDKDMIKESISQLAERSGFGSAAGARAQELVEKWADKERIDNAKSHMAARSRKIVETAFLQSAGLFLEKEPVYRLKKDLSGYIVKSLLDDIEVKEGAITARIDIWRFGAPGMLLLIVSLISLAGGIYIFSCGNDKK